MDDNTQLPDGLQKKLDAVSEAVEKEYRKRSRFDKTKALTIGLICMGLTFTFAIAVKSTVGQAALFAVFVGITGYITGGYQAKGKR